jgi:hypothetical protein
MKKNSAAYALRQPRNESTMKVAPRRCTMAIAFGSNDNRSKSAERLLLRPAARTSHRARWDLIDRGAQIAQPEVRLRVRKGSPGKSDPLAHQRETISPLTAP